MPGGVVGASGPVVVRDATRVADAAGASDAPAPVGARLTTSARGRASARSRRTAAIACGAARRGGAWTPSTMPAPRPKKSISNFCVRRIGACVLLALVMAFDMRHVAVGVVDGEEAESVLENFHDSPGSR